MTVPAGQRVTRTAAQGAAAAAVIVVLAWVASLTGLDLDPGVGEGVPLEVAAAIQALITWLVALGMNRPAVEDEDDLDALAL